MNFVVSSNHRMTCGTHSQSLVVDSKLSTIRNLPETTSSRMDCPVWPSGGGTARVLIATGRWSASRRRALNRFDWRSTTTRVRVSRRSRSRQEISWVQESFGSIRFDGDSSNDFGRFIQIVSGLTYCVDAATCASSHWLRTEWMITGEPVLDQ